MATSRGARHAWLYLASAALLWTALVAAKPSIPMDYCASINTASMGANSSIYQSDGLCYHFCEGQYALAIVQEKSCWCSDYIPGKSSQVSTDECSNSCPGFPDDVCGGDGLFGYMTLKKPAAGTANTGSTTSSSVKETVKTETVQSTVQDTITYIPPSEPSTTSSRLPNTNPSPTVSTVTADGTVRTVTVTPTAGGNSPSSATSSSSSKKGLSTGAAVGIAIGVIGVFAAIAAIVVCLFIKRRRQRQAEEQGEFDAPSQRGSSSGMMGTPKTGEMSENRFAGGSDGRTMAESWENSAQGRRRSTLMPVDPRMDPFNKNIYNRAENKSHESVNTLRDDQDYSRRVHNPSRVLRATNPDPDAD
ncbi:hypothetical protein QBC33DRAFT_163646 [Phialemonium atrogriseum]|uniref:WSC domain-containing protein n=1 Tax=Phialemonium atrogriseum TaxID=1093897 RepID=A0AAJ0FQV8_9PEZI|nr:uncharacterized protein QBC33DRAFT_163646 [Phialemonium atrogriseum]KAK1771704.1 hypothetical protein QBC33DRAFT_163646 [Phialemonium atrogriseum]